MNEFLKWLCISGSIVLIVGLLLSGLGKVMGGSFSWSSGDGLKLQGDDVIEKTLELDSFTKIVVENSSINLNVEKGSDYSLEYRVYEWQVPTAEVKDGTLYLTAPQWKNKGFHIQIQYEKTYYTIKVPEGNYDVEIGQSSGNFNMTDVNASGKISLTSGNIHVTNCESEDIVITASSGNMYLDDITAKELNAKTTSGNIFVKKAEADEISCSLSSGNIDIEDTAAKSIETAHTSGNVRLTNVKADTITSGGGSGNLDAENCSFGKFNGKLTSGNMDVSDSDIANVDCEASSGLIKLALNGNKDDYSYELKCSSGEIHFNGEKEGNSFTLIHDSVDADAKNIKIQTTSGNIKVEVK